MDDKLSYLSSMYSLPAKPKRLVELEERVLAEAIASYKDDKHVLFSVVVSEEEYRAAEDYTREVESWEKRTGSSSTSYSKYWDTVIGVQTPWGFVEIKKEEKE